ncbi:hypothetical protein CJ030_MR3G018994 [Morella rubra]|uniref:Uncharacterized protein n=1 Tax=Morella rubra TaxID=262757 RepID=A0A6A1W735_9ROSI|nr:hypothetical protein CJ030_MR3G018994 [Morella rubra]
MPFHPLILKKNCTPLSFSLSVISPALPQPSSPHASLIHYSLLSLPLPARTRPPFPNRRRRPTQVSSCRPLASTTDPLATGTLCRLPDCLSTPGLSWLNGYFNHSMLMLLT